MTVDDSDEEPMVVAHEIGTGPRAALLMYEKKDVYTWAVSDCWVHLDNVR